MDFYGYKIHRNKPKAFKEILDVLKYMVDNKMIEVKQDLDLLSYDTGIEIKILAENFDSPNRFAKLTSSQFNVIMMADSPLNKENVLMVFLYINSYIGCRNRDNKTINTLNTQDNHFEDKPEVFWRSIKSMAKDLSMSKDTINQCLDYLTTSTDTHSALLIKKEVGSIQPDKTKPPKNVPNIYVLNKKGSEQEIELALDEIRKKYKVDEFYPSKSGNFRFN